jgi:hypothetical protein
MLFMLFMPLVNENLVAISDNKEPWRVANGKGSLDCALLGNCTGAIDRFLCPEAAPALIWKSE